MTEMPYPIELQRAGDGCVIIKWSDEVILRYRPKKVRDACPCATCREKRQAAQDELEKKGKEKKLPVLSPQEMVPLQISGMRPVGNYAYNVAFSDGHDSGIFGFALLRELGDSP